MSLDVLEAITLFFSVLCYFAVITIFILLVFVILYKVWEYLQLIVIKRKLEKQHNSYQDLELETRTDTQLPVPDAVHYRVRGDKRRTVNYVDETSEQWSNLRI